MKKTQLFARILVAMMLSSPVVASAGPPKPETAGEYVDDSVITAKVKSELASDHFLKSFQIGVETYKGVVQLSGFVDSQEAASRAGEVARRVSGVVSVKNSLIVK